MCDEKRMEAKEEREREKVVGSGALPMESPYPHLRFACVTPFIFFFPGTLIRHFLLLIRDTFLIQSKSEMNNKIQTFQR